MKIFSQSYRDSGIMERLVSRGLIQLEMTTLTKTLPSIEAIEKVVSSKISYIFNVSLEYVPNNREGELRTYQCILMGDAYDVAK